MKRWAVFVIVIVVSFFIVGCSDIFEYNLFSSVDKPSIPTVSELKSMGSAEAVDKLSGEASSDKFYDELAGNESEKTEIQEYLKDVMDNPETETPVKQKASLLYANIEIKTTGADGVVNNLVNVISAGNVSGFDDVWNAIVPDTMGEDDVVNVLGGLLNAYQGYSNFGSTLVGSTTAPDDVNMGDVAQTAIVSYYVYQYAVNNGIDPTSDNAPDALYDKLQNVDETNVALPDPTEDQSFSAILSVAGLNYNELF